MQTTIYALSSGSPPSGVAVIRVSGPSVKEILADLVDNPPAPRNAALRTIRSRNGDMIDQGLILHFPAPASFTGEDCLELQIHGGRAVVNRLLAELGTFPETRPADAGEFTKRAFENGKIDLVEAEGLADLLSAETEMQRRLAAEHSRGQLSALYRSWADRITYARAMIEAELDFADEDDVPGSVASQVWSQIEAVSMELSAHLATAKAGEIIRDGFRIAIIGRPNAGKSSLLNALARRDIAIVTDVAGTTRDVISVDLDIGGYAVRLADTAGIRNTDDLVEQEGVRRAYAEAAEADLILHLRDPLDETPELEISSDVKRLRISTKSDLHASAFPFDFAVSTTTGSGLDMLLTAIQAIITERTAVNSLAIPSRIRHVNHLTETLRFLDAALSKSGEGLDIRAECLRMASRHLGRITGAVDVEALLDVIFSEFCIGK